MPRKDPQRVDRGPKLTEDVCIGEEVKIGVNLALQRFRLDPTQEELAFPSSLSATERAYVHRYCAQMGGLQTWSRGTGNGRYITVKKTEAGQHSSSVSKSCFSLSHSAPHVNDILTKFPITEAEKQNFVFTGSKPAATYDGPQKDTQGKLTRNTPQVPPQRGHSGLEKFRQSLPVFKMGDDIVRQINASKAILIAGETGSGKTTQVPQLILDDCHNSKKACRILCTQPRRIAAISIAERIAQERGEKLGQTVGYQIRLESKLSAQTVLTFCTNGVLLRTLMGGDDCLEQVTHVIVDEVHERDRFSDFLLLCLKEAMPKHPNLRVILMSATLNMELFSGYYDGCPVVCVPGNLHDVEEYFLEDILKWTNYRNKAMSKASGKKKSPKSQVEQLTEWCSVKLAISEKADSVADSGTEQESDVATSDNAELGDEQDDLEPWVEAEMDRLLRDVWLTGREDLFSQILYLISSENVSVDYVQTETGTTPLMTAAARGMGNVVEHLLNLGASASYKTANQWTALDFARKFEHEDIVGLLEAQMKSLSSMIDEGDTTDNFELMTPEDRELLSAYQQSFDDEKVDTQLVLSLIHKIHTSGPAGAMLIFLPGYDDIMSLKTQLEEDHRFRGARFVVYLLHSSLQHSDQKKVFKNAPNGVRKIILSTNIAETSVTIDDVVFVIDCGKVKEKTFDALSSLTMLKSNWISKASALQRKGRAGRCQAGKCYHMFSRARYIHLQDYQTPEILRLPLQELCLHTKLLAPSTEPIQEFLGKCPQAPPQLVICTAVQNLRSIDALDEFENLTELGRHLADLPIEPRLGKILLYSVALRCLDPVLTIVCTLSFKEPFVLPSLPSEKRSVMNKKRSLAEQTYSDHIVYLRAFQAWQKAKMEGWERAFCEKSYISSSTMEMLSGMRTQILTQLKASGFLQARGACDIKDLNTNSDNWALVKACLVAGTYPNIIHRDSKKNMLCTSFENSIRFHTSSVLMPAPTAGKRGILPTSALKKEVKALPSDWLIYEEMSRTSNVAIAKHCSLVSPTAVFLFGGHSKVTADMVLDTPAQEDDEDKHNSVTVKLDNWLSFTFQNHQEAETSLLFRMKWHSFFLNRVRHPGKAYSQEEEAVLQAVSTVLSNAEQALGIGIPTGIGQRPRMNDLPTGSGMADDRGGYHQGYQQHHYDHHNNNNHYHHMQHQQQQYYHYNNHHQQWNGFGNYSNHRGGYSYYQQHRGNQHGYNRRGHQGMGRGMGDRADMSRSSIPNSASGMVSPRSSDLQSAQRTAQASSFIQEEGCRYFIMRANNQKIVDYSESNGVWVTTAKTEETLNKAFQSSKGVYLIILLPNNANFQGYAKMTSAVERSKNVSLLGSGLIGSCSVEWIKRAVLPFSMTNSLLNPWNDNKKIHFSKDGQEVAPNMAVTLIQLWDSHQLRRPTSAGTASSNSGGAGGKGGHRRRGGNSHHFQHGPPHHQQNHHQQQQHHDQQQQPQRQRPKKTKQGAGKDSTPQAIESASGSASAQVSAKTET